MASASRARCLAEIAEPVATLEKNRHGIPECLRMLDREASRLAAGINQLRIFALLPWR